jgi:hypothetical protein
MHDVEGLDRTYARCNVIYSRNHTMLVAGTKDSPRDHWDELKLTFNLNAESLRYRNANTSLQANPQSRSLVGHYLAGSVIL